ncbi:hypothetical protein [Paraburkholderia panacisoli]|uniref:hypothetical protein n=1 Tax=Paraburkholderia panacisoli TaxID=2603818 RepID=UPI001FE5877C|nr:hypothetical protein [Paraburkholderia panacisoli]
MRHSRVDADDEVEASDQRSGLSERGEARRNITQHPALIEQREGRSITVADVPLQREEIRIGIQQRLQLFERYGPFAIVQMRHAARPCDPNARPSTGACEQIVPLRDKRIVRVQIWTRRRQIGCTNLERKRQTEDWDMKIEPWNLGCLADDFGRTRIILEKWQ